MAQGIRDYFEIKDRCRGKLAAHTRKAFRMIPSMRRPSMLDLGCGTGVSSIELALLGGGALTAVDADEASIGRLREKLREHGLEDRITPVQAAVPSSDIPPGPYDIVVAEGLLNIIGFKKGMVEIERYVKHEGFAIIHDEVPGKEEKLALFKKHGFHLLFSFVLDEKVWWDDYYVCLEKAIEEFDAARAGGRETPDPFVAERSEIDDYRRDPGRFRSVFYIIQKQSWPKK